MHNAQYGSAAELQTVVVPDGSDVGRRAAVGRGDRKHGNVLSSEEILKFRLGEDLHVG